MDVFGDPNFGQIGQNIERAATAAFAVDHAARAASLRQSKIANDTGQLALDSARRKTKFGERINHMEDWIAEQNDGVTDPTQMKRFDEGAIHEVGYGAGMGAEEILTVINGLKANNPQLYEDTDVRRSLAGRGIVPTVSSAISSAELESGRAHQVDLKTAQSRAGGARDPLGELVASKIANWDSLSTSEQRMYGTIADYLSKPEFEKVTTPDGDGIVDLGAPVPTVQPLGQMTQRRNPETNAIENILEPTDFDLGSADGGLTTSNRTDQANAEALGMSYDEYQFVKLITTITRSGAPVDQGIVRKTLNDLLKNRGGAGPSAGAPATGGNVKTQVPEGFIAVPGG